MSTDSNREVEEIVEDIIHKSINELDTKEMYAGFYVNILKEEISKAIQQERQTSQEREREVVGKLFEALDYQNTERELNAKEEDRMGIKLALQQFKLKFLTEYNITLTNPNKD